MQLGAFRAGPVPVVQTQICSLCFPIETHPDFFAPTCRASLQTPGPCRALWLLQCRVHSPGHRAGAAFCPPGKSPVLLQPGSARSKKIPQKNPESSSYSQTVPSRPIKLGTSHPMSHFRCALAKRSEMMDSFQMCSNTERC